MALLFSTKSHPLHGPLQPLKLERLAHHHLHPGIFRQKDSSKQPKAFKLFSTTPNIVHLHEGDFAGVNVIHGTYYCKFTFVDHVSKYGTTFKDPLNGQFHILSRNGFDKGHVLG